MVAGGENAEEQRLQAAHAAAEGARVPLLRFLHGKRRRVRIAPILRDPIFLPPTPFIRGWTARIYVGG